LKVIDSSLPSLAAYLRQCYPAKDQLLPFHAVANRTGMDWLEPMLIQGANNMTDEQVPHHVERTLELLKSQL